MNLLLYLVNTSVKNNNFMDHNLFDFDGNINHGIHLALNPENEDNKCMHLWKFI